MSEQKHTPTPWSRFDADSLEIVGPDGHEVCSVFQCGGIREIDEAVANRDIIFRAVNSHEALVDAITSRATNAAVKSGLGVSEWRAFLNEKERAALALAEKGSN